MKPRHVVAHSVWSGGQARGVHGNPTGGRQVFGWVAPASDEPKTVGQERLVVGLQVTIGAQLLPLMTQLVIWATTRLVPMLKRTGDWLKNHHRQIADLAPKILKVALALAGVFSAIKLVNDLAHHVDPRAGGHPGRPGGARRRRGRRRYRRPRGGPHLRLPPL